MEKINFNPGPGDLVELKDQSEKLPIMRFMGLEYRAGCGNDCVKVVLEEALPHTTDTQTFISVQDFLDDYQKVSNLKVWWKKFTMPIRYYKHYDTVSRIKINAQAWQRKT